MEDDEDYDDYEAYFDEMVEADANFDVNGGDVDVKSGDNVDDDNGVEDDEDENGGVAHDENEEHDDKDEKDGTAHRGDVESGEAYDVGTNRISEDEGNSKSDGKEGNSESGFDIIRKGPADNAVRNEDDARKAEMVEEKDDNNKERHVGDDDDGSAKVRKNKNEKTRKRNSSKKNKSTSLKESTPKTATTTMTTRTITDVGSASKRSTRASTDVDKYDNKISVDGNMENNQAPNATGTGDGKNIDQAKSNANAEDESQSGDPSDAKKIPAASGKANPKNRHLTRKEANALLLDSGEAIQRALEQLEEARELAARAGLSVDSNVVPKPISVGTSWSNSNNSNNNNNSTSASSDIANRNNSGTSLVLGSMAYANNSWMGTGTSAATSTTAANTSIANNSIPTNTGGHSNTDHVVVRTGDERKDRIAELKRNLLRRHRAMQPENRGEDRWDKPRIPGERRRRIVREKDSPEAPPEPPPTGYVAFVGQMTTKIRHDRPNAPHDQAKVVQEISKIWRIGMTEEDRNYYNDFAMDAKREYEKQVVEYRATGSFTPSKRFGKLDDVNVWIRYPPFQNGLEREISQYITCLFPKRPKEMDSDYERREERSKLKRKLKVKGLWNDDGTLKNGLDFEEVLKQEQEKNKKAKQQHHQQQKKEQEEELQQQLKQLLQRQGPP